MNSNEEAVYMEEEGIRLICLKDDGYPEVLKNIYDPPQAIYCKGELCPGDINSVAIVGARRCSLYGLQMAEKLAFDLAVRGITVVSGMAMGIDSAAHRGALKAGGRTIAVMGSGFKDLYPRGSEKLFRSISENGAVLTEYPSDTPPLRKNFPRRNRIISGLSKGVVVVEAARKSGAMITVDLALSEGREVFAVPGRTDLSTSGGTNRLIQEGAKLVTCADDIIEELNIEPGGAALKRVDRIEDKESHGMLELLRKEVPVHIDRISELTGMDQGPLSEVLLRMELKGSIRALPGGNYVLKRSEVYAR